MPDCVQLLLQSRRGDREWSSQGGERLRTSAPSVGKATLATSVGSKSLKAGSWSHVRWSGAGLSVRAFLRSRGPWLAVAALALAVAAALAVVASRCGASVGEGGGGGSGRRRGWVGPRVALAMLGSGFPGGFWIRPKSLRKKSNAERLQEYSWSALQAGMRISNDRNLAY